MSINRRKLLTLLGLGAMAGPSAVASAPKAAAVTPMAATGGYLTRLDIIVSDNVPEMLSNGEYIISARQYFLLQQATLMRSMGIKK